MFIIKSKNVRNSISPLLFSTYVLLLLSVIALCSCNDATKIPSNYIKFKGAPQDTIDHTSQAYEIEVQSNVPWAVSYSGVWLKAESIPSATNGENNGMIRLEIDENTESSARIGIVELKDNNQKILASLKITQREWRIESHTYDLPIIFHVLSNGEISDISELESNINKLITSCNRYYNSKFEHNMQCKLKFSLATIDPDNRPMQINGINIIQTADNKRDALEFYNSKSPSDVGMLWDADRYINIFLYDFIGASGSMGGVSVFPYSVGDKHLDGLKDVEKAPNADDINYMHCIMVNKRYITRQDKSRAANNFVVNDMATILSHEMGHYLGLFHIFSEAGANSLCADSDFCQDTPCYDRDKYSKSIKNLEQNYKENLAVLLKREECEYGDEVEPDNLMDYDYSWNDQITPEQISRIRFVLENSPLIPGPKNPNSLASKNNSISRMVLEPQFAID